MKIVKYKIWTEGGKELNVFNEMNEALEWIGTQHFTLIAEQKGLRSLIFIVK